MRLPRKVWRVIRSRRARIAFVWLVFGGIALLGLGYVGADYWGKRQAREYLREMEERGYPLSLEEYLGQGVTGEDNVLKHPRMDEQIATGRLDRLDAADFSLPSGLARQAERSPVSGTRPKLALVDPLPRARLHLADPLPVGEWFAPRLELSEKETADVLLASLDKELKFAGMLEEAIRRPTMAWPSETAYTPYGTAIEETRRVRFRLLKVADFMKQAAQLQLAAERADEAAEKIGTLYRLANHFDEAMQSTSGPLVGGVIRQRAGKLIQEGAIRDAWSEAQLERFQAAMGRSVTSSELLNRVLEYELVAYLDGLRNRVRGGFDRGDVGLLKGWKWEREAISERLEELWRRLRPPGLWLSERVGVIRTIDEWKQRHASEPDAEIDVEAAKRVESEYHSDLVRAPLGVADALIMFETTDRLHRIGVALERYHLAAGAYPESLSMLVPRYLDAVPEDPWTGEPMRYERMANGGPKVWSVGKNQVDEGGLPSRVSGSGDWVWITRPIPGFTEVDYGRR